MIQGQRMTSLEHPLERVMGGLQCPQGRSLQTRVQMVPLGDGREAEEGSS